MKLYLLVAYYKYYPEGGLNDVKGYSFDKEELEPLLSTLKSKSYYDHIYIDEINLTDIRNHEQFIKSIEDDAF